MYMYNLSNTSSSRFTQCWENVSSLSARMQLPAVNETTLSKICPSVQTQQQYQQGHNANITSSHSKRWMKFVPRRENWNKSYYLLLSTTYHRCCFGPIQSVTLLYVQQKPVVVEWTWTLLWTSPSSAVVPFFQLWYGENGCLVSFLLNGWILLNVGMMQKILHYLIKDPMLLSNLRFSASFRRLEKSTQ